MGSPKFRQKNPHLSGFILLGLFLLSSGIFYASVLNPNTFDPQKTVGDIRLNMEQIPINVRNLNPRAAIETPSNANLTDFFESFMPQYLIDKQIAGASIMVVNSSDILVSSCWGYTDPEQMIPICANETLFRVGELSALFTWTAVMQLVEAGKLDLTVDINTYLDNTTLEISSPFDDTITLHHLMTHTAGFEEALIG